MVSQQPNVYMRYDGEDWNEKSVKSAYGKLIAYLFYIELEIITQFYISPEICYLRKCCRIPPSPVLVDLLVRLR